jgi:hypothetical protein
VAAFQLRPDIVVSDGGQVRFVVDKKWKRLKPADFRDGVASADVYQMYAYSSRYAAPEVVLLYPHHAELGEWKARRAEYWLDDGVMPGDLRATHRRCHNRPSRFGDRAYAARPSFRGPAGYPSS